MSESEASTQSTEAQSTESTEAATPSFNYAEGIAGSGEKPAWFKDSKYTTVADQAKAYGELETRLGGFTGKPDEYSFNEGISAEDSPMLNGLKELGAKYNMNNDMFNDIVSMNLKAEEDAQAAYQAKEIENLGENGQARIDNVNDWLGANVSEGLKNFLSDNARSAEDIGFIEEFIKASKGQPLADANIVASTSAFTDEGLRELQFAQDERGNRLSRNPEHRKKVNDYAEKLLLQNK